MQTFEKVCTSLPPDEAAAGGAAGQQRVAQA
jgi:hypothetical protein